MDGPVLVLGATSLVGRFVPAAAAARGTHLVGVSRSPPPAIRSEDAAYADWVRADLPTPGWGERLPRAERALSLSPIWLLPPALPALAQAGVRRLIAFSSTSRLTKAASPDAGERAVAQALARAEAEAEAIGGALGIGLTLLRPTLIYAEGLDANVSRLAALIRRFGVLPLSGEGEGLRQPVHAADLAAVALRALDRPEAIGRAYDLPGGETLSYRAMAERVFAGLGRRPRILTVPPGLWRLGLALAAPLLPGATAAMGARMGENLTFDPGPAARDLGWAPRPFHPRFQR